MASERSKKIARSLAVSGLLLGLVAPTRDAQAEDATDSARAHYARGYRLASAGEFEAATAEFERAYALSPNYSVLFNLGQAYGAAGKAVQAAHTLEKYLELGGANLSLEERKRVAALLEVYHRRIGKLSLEVRPSGAEIVVDGRRIGTSPLASEAELDAGLHGLVIEADGFVTHTQSVTVAPGETMSSVIQLRQRPDAAWLELSCTLPDVQIRIDDTEHGKTPLRAPLALTGGSHRLQLSRPGYHAADIELRVEAGKVARHSCALARGPRDGDDARLSVVHPRGTNVRVDGEPFRGEWLARGAHRVLVEGARFESRELYVRLAPRATKQIRIVPSLSRAELERGDAQRARAQRLVAYVVGGVALAAGTTSAIVAIDNAARYSEFRLKNRAFALNHANQSTAEATRALDELLVEENSIRNRDALALGLGVAGGALFATSLALWLTAGSSQPTVTVTGSGAQLGYRGRF